MDSCEGCIQHNPRGGTITVTLVSMTTPVQMQGIIRMARIAAERILLE